MKSDDSFKALLIGALLEIRDELEGLRKDLSVKPAARRSLELSGTQTGKLIRLIQEKLIDQAERNRRGLS
jgi:hypothetical protein